VLLIVKKIQRSDDLSDDVVEVLRITDDPELIEKYQMDGNNFTPAKVWIAYLFLFLHEYHETYISILLC
jgi:hypothetical protein